VRRMAKLWKLACIHEPPARMGKVPVNVDNAVNVVNVDNPINVDNAANVVNVDNPINVDDTLRAATLPAWENR
jgi:hypothetical protein